MCIQPGYIVISLICKIWRAVNKMFLDVFSVSASRKKQFLSHSLFMASKNTGVITYIILHRVDPDWRHIWNAVIAELSAVTGIVLSLEWCMMSFEKDHFTISHIKYIICSSNVGVWHLWTRRQCTRTYNRNTGALSRIHFCRGNM